MILYFKKLDEEATVPSRSFDRSIGWDLYAFCLTEQRRPSHALIPPRTTRAIKTGIAPMNDSGQYYLQICSRSGLAMKSIFVANAPGIIDPDYTGEIVVLLYNGGHESYYVKHGDRIAQAIPAPVMKVDMRVLPVDYKMPDTPRGAKGFGSSGR